MVRSRTWPSPGEGSAYSSIRKSDAFGSPTGRETRMTRFVWDMVVSSYFFLSSRRARILCGDLRQRSIERRCRARQILEYQSAIGGLLLRRSRRGPDFGHWPTAIEQRQRRDHLEF